MLLLRVPDPLRPPAPEANALLDRLAGAEVRFVSHEEYQRRGEVMAAVARELAAAGRRPYVIPEGGSSALGSLGYVLAMAELRDQLPAAWRTGPLTIAYAAGSGGTGAGIELGLRLLGWSGATPRRVRGLQRRRLFQETIAAIGAEARTGAGPRSRACRARRSASTTRSSGPGYAQTTPEGLEVIRRAAREDGVVLDPVYTGKAMLGVRVPRREAGGLPGAAGRVRPHAAASSACSRSRRDSRASEPRGACRPDRGGARQTTPGPVTTGHIEAQEERGCPGRSRSRRGWTTGPACSAGSRSRSGSPA